MSQEFRELVANELKGQATTQVQELLRQPESLDLWESALIELESIAALQLGDLRAQLATIQQAHLTGQVAPTVYFTTRRENDVHRAACRTFLGAVHSRKAEILRLRGHVPIDIRKQRAMEAQIRHLEEALARKDREVGAADKERREATARAKLWVYKGKKLAESVNRLVGLAHRKHDPLTADAMAAALQDMIRIYSATRELPSEHSLSTQLDHVFEHMELGD